MSVNLQSRLAPASKRDALLKALLQKQGIAQAEIDRIQPRESTGEIPLSFAQQRLWFLDQLVSGSPVYNIPVALRLRGELDVAALEKALGEIVRRHEVLRTTYSASAGRAVQVVQPAEECRISVFDLRMPWGPVVEAEVIKWATDEAHEPFDLSRGPLLRTTLLQLADYEHILLLTVHHIAADGWSVNVMFRELQALYAAYSRGQKSPLPDLQIQYADFAVWQREHLQGKKLDDLVSYWKNKLKDTPGLLNLPFDHPRPAVQSFKGDCVHCALSPRAVAGIKQLCAEESVSLFMLVLAAYKLLLYRYSGQDDICVGTSIASRNRSELEPLIGFFVNTLAMRTMLDGNPTFVELLQRVRTTALEAFAHQDLPFEKLVDAVESERNLSHSPLFQAAFTWQNASAGSFDLPGLDVSLVQGECRTAKFDVTFAVIDDGSGITGMFEYNTDLFERATIERLASHFELLMERLAENPRQNIDCVDFLPVAERDTVIVEWNRTQRPYPPECIHELFARQVEHTPDTVALKFENESLTYSELNARANKVAHYLRSFGVGPEVRVGICLERSIELIVAILGVLKAGGAYVPMDPAYPSERLAYMMEDSGIALLLTNPRAVANAPSGKVAVLSIRDARMAIDAMPASTPVTGVTQRNLAYVIYTSGSTGRPKGTLIPHVGVPNLIQELADMYEMRPGDRLLQFASISFDASVIEIHIALTTGSCLVLARKETLTSPADFLDLLRREEIAAVLLPPSLLSALPAEDLPALRTILSAGESCSPEIVARWGSGRQLLNGYGPTEITVASSIQKVDPTAGDTVIPIGRPVANTQTYVLDRFLQPVPIGVPGEICIGGLGVCRGYHGRTDLTAEKFVPNPFSTEPGTRLYRSGDLGRWRCDGTLEFMGRLDHQVKIRGFRIEPQEIEAVLEKHPLIQRAAVLTRQDGTGGTRLIAYAAPGTDSVSLGQIAPSSQELRAYLQERLPDYMVPSAIVVVPEFPLTPNGKIDRKALPSVESAHPERTVEFIPPSNEMEQKLADAWAAVLGVDRVGRNDNFFELGGDSILTIQIIARANQAGILLTARQMFQYQTVAQLAAVASLVEGNAAEQGLVSGTLPLTPVQSWFFEQELDDLHHWNQAFMLKVPG